MYILYYAHLVPMVYNNIGYSTSVRQFSDLLTEGEAILPLMCMASVLQMEFIPQSSHGITSI